jgi:hypothetical protein
MSEFSHYIGTRSSREGRGLYGNVCYCPGTSYPYCSIVNNSPMGPCVSIKSLLSRVQIRLLSFVFFAGPCKLCGARVNC